MILAMSDVVTALDTGFDSVEVTKEANKPRTKTVVLHELAQS
jgi:hypothetical protein